MTKSISRKFRGFRPAAEGLCARPIRTDPVLTAVLPVCTIISMKTAISLPDDMFKEIEEVTKECDCSRSQVFAMAVSEFLERRKSRKLLEALNDAYQETEAPEETRARRQALSYHAKRARKEPY